LYLVSLNFKRELADSSKSDHGNLGNCWSHAV